jgi:hypothetical protein
MANPCPPTATAHQVGTKNISAAFAWARTWWALNAIANKKFLLSAFQGRFEPPIKMSVQANAADQRRLPESSSALKSDTSALNIPPSKQEEAGRKE